MGSSLQTQKVVQGLIQGANQIRFSVMADAPPAEETPPEGEEVVAADPEIPPCADLTECQIKIDHFDKIHALSEEGKIDGAPNYRQVAGFPVFGCAQPTTAGLKTIIDKLKPAEGVKSKLNYYNMRQEPVVYINGTPFAPRASDQLHENMVFEDPVPDLENLENHFLKVCSARLEASGNGALKTHKDVGYTENPMEREDKEEDIKVESLTELKAILAELTAPPPAPEPEEPPPEVPEGEEPPPPPPAPEPDFLVNCIRVPVVEEGAPAESCFDIMLESLKDEPASTQCVFSCQMGRGRTTLGMVVACLIKEIQVRTELKKLMEDGLVPQETVEGLIKQKFEAPMPRLQDDDDPFIKGEFDVIKELLEKMPEAVEGKKKVDRVIDICGTSPKGTGLQNLRECIIETKWKYDVAPEEKQVVWKRMILNFMERYFYLICFGTYSLEVGASGFQKSFTSWMDERPHLRTMIEEGKDKLEWYRQVDPAKLNTLKDLINAPNYKDNLATLIRTIYEFAFLTYADLPRGPIKNNSMRKLAAKTLMEILPTDIGQEIQKKLDEHTASPDFITLIGLVSYHDKNAE